MTAERSSSPSSGDGHVIPTEMCQHGLPTQMREEDGWRVFYPKGPCGCSTDQPTARWKLGDGTVPEPRDYVRLAYQPCPVVVGCVAQAGHLGPCVPPLGVVDAAPPPVPSGDPHEWSPPPPLPLATVHVQAGPVCGLCGNLIRLGELLIPFSNINGGVSGRYRHAIDSPSCRSTP